MTNDIDDRLSKRFDDEQDDETDESTGQSQSDMSSPQPQIDKTAQTSRKAQNIKKEWNVRSFYLDDDLDSELSTAFKRLDLSLSEAEADINLKKTRHFYPLVVQLGLEQLESMEVTEVTEILEENASE